jgi:hypothetical protein
MSDTTALAIVAAVPGIISTILSFIIKYKQGINHQEVSDRIDVLESNTNGKMNQLLEVTGASEHAKGVLEGKADERSSK